MLSLDLASSSVQLFGCFFGERSPRPEYWREQPRGRRRNRAAFGAPRWGGELPCCLCPDFWPLLLLWVR